MLRKAHVVRLGVQALMGSSKRLDAALAALAAAVAVTVLLLGDALPLALRRGEAHG